MINGNKTVPPPNEDNLQYKKAEQEIADVKMMCRSNLGGQWELAFLPYSGGYYEQPADEMEKIREILSVVNRIIDEKNDN